MTGADILSKRHIRPDRIGQHHRGKLLVYGELWPFFRFFANPGWQVNHFFPGKQSSARQRFAQTGRRYPNSSIAGR